MWEEVVGVAGRGIWGRLVLVCPTVRASCCPMSAKPLGRGGALDCARGCAALSRQWTGRAATATPMATLWCRWRRAAAPRKVRGEPERANAASRQRTGRARRCSHTHGHIAAPARACPENNLMHARPIHSCVRVGGHAPTISPANPQNGTMRVLRFHISKCGICGQIID